MSNFWDSKRLPSLRDTLATSSINWFTHKEWQGRPPPSMLPPARLKYFPHQRTWVRRDELRVSTIQSSTTLNTLPSSFPASMFCSPDAAYCSTAASCKNSDGAFLKPSCKWHCAIREQCWIFSPHSIFSVSTLVLPLSATIFIAMLVSMVYALPMSL